MKKLFIFLAMTSISMAALAQDPRPRNPSNGTVIGGGSNRTSNGQGPHPMPGPQPQPRPAPMPFPETGEIGQTEKHDCKVVMVKNEIYGRKRTLYTYVGQLDGVGSCREALIRCRADITAEMVKESGCWQVLDQVYL